MTLHISHTHDASDMLHPAGLHRIGFIVVKSSVVASPSNLLHIEHRNAFAVPAWCGQQSREQRVVSQGTPRIQSQLIGIAVLVVLAVGPILPIASIARMRSRVAEIPNVVRFVSIDVFFAALRGPTINFMSFSFIVVTVTVNLPTTANPTLSIDLVLDVRVGGIQSRGLKEIWGDPRSLARSVLKGMSYATTSETHEKVTVCKPKNVVRHQTLQIRNNTYLLT